MLHAYPWEFTLQFEDDFATQRGSAAGPTLDVGEVVGVDDGVTDETDEDRGDYKELVDAVAGDGVEEEGDCELGE